MSNLWNKPKSLRDLADEIVNRMSQPQYPYQGGAGAVQPPAVGGYGAGHNAGLLGTFNYSQSDAASGSRSSQPGGTPTTKSSPQPKDDQGATKFLDSLSRDELRQLKNALGTASRQTQALTILLGGALVVVNPVSWLVLIPIFTGIVALTFDQAAAEIDKRLEAQ